MSSTCKKRRFVSHGGDIWGFSRKYNIPLEEVLEFSGPINFLGPSPKAVEAVKQNAKLISFYPDPNPVEFKEEIAKYVGHGVEEENILLGNGSIELIYMITEILPQGFKAVIPVPSFSEYEKAALRVGGEPVFVQLPENFALETEKIKKAVTDDTKIMCICNPHSPSGTLYRKEEILDLVEFCNKKDIIFSVDENYIEFADESLENTVGRHGEGLREPLCYSVSHQILRHGRHTLRLRNCSRKPHRQAGDSSAAVEHQRLSRFSYAGSLQRHRIHRKHQRNHRQRTSRHSPKA